MDNFAPLWISEIRRVARNTWRNLLSERGEADISGEAGEDGGDGGGGTGTIEAPPAAPEDWRTNIDVGFREHPSLTNFKSVNDLAKSWVNAQKLIGREKIPVPGKDAKPEDWDVVYDRLGRPKTPEEYQIGEVALPEGFPALDENLTKEFKAQAHKLGLLPGQVDQLYQWFMGYNAGEFERFGKERSEAMARSQTEMRREYGKAYEANIALARKVVQSYGDKDTAAALEEGLGNDPRLVRMLVKIGKTLSEHSLGNLPGSGAMMTPAEAKAEISKIMNDPKHAYFNQLHPEHDAAIGRMQQLHQLASEG